MLERTKVRLEIFLMIVVLIASLFLIGLLCYLSEIPLSTPTVGGI